MMSCNCLIGFLLYANPTLRSFGFVIDSQFLRDIRLFNKRNAWFENNSEYQCPVFKTRFQRLWCKDRI